MKGKSAKHERLVFCFLFGGSFENSCLCGLYYVVDSVIADRGGIGYIIECYGVCMIMILMIVKRSCVRYHEF